MERVHGHVLVFFCFVFLSISSGDRVLADTLDVCPEGCSYLSIQEAIDNAGPGDTILVEDGTYRENINFGGMNITVRSVNGAGSATMDGGYFGSTVTFDSGEDSSAVLDGFTIRNGSSGFGGGIHCSSSSPTIANCSVTENRADDGGGGIYIYNSTSTL